MMPYPEFLLRQRGAAIRQLLLVHAVQLAQATRDDLGAVSAFAQLREAANG